MIYLEGALKICRFGMVVKILVNSLLYGILISCVVILFVFKEEEKKEWKERVRLDCCDISQVKCLWCESR